MQARIRQKTVVWVHGIVRITRHRLDYLRTYRESLYRVGLAVTPSAAAGRPARLREARIDSAAAKNDAAIAVNDKLSLGLRSGAAVTTVARPERTA